MIKTACYIRVSSDRQAKEGESVPAQREALDLYIKEHKELKKVGEYLDDGISGTKFKERDELQRMLADVKAGKIDKIIFTKLDRLYRSIRHYTATQETLDQYGVTWVAIWEPVYDTSTPAGRLIVNQMMSIAQFEAENTGQRIRQVMDYKRRRGEVLSGHVPFGYKIEEKHLIPDAKTENVARELFETYSKTSSLTETMRLLEGTGIPTHISSINDLLRNTTYIGKHNGRDDYCEPIIPPELFDDVQRKLKMNIRTKTAQHTYIFTGLLRCSCGKKMSGSTHRGARKKYRCEGYYKKAGCINGWKPAETEIENYLIKNLYDLIRAEMRPREYEIKEQDRTPDAGAQIDAIKHKIDRLKDLYINDLIDIETYKADLAKFNEMITEIESRPRKRDFKTLEAVLRLDIPAIYKTLSEAEKRRFWRGFIDHIEAAPDRRLTVFFL